MAVTIRDLGHIDWPRDRYTPHEWVLHGGYWVCTRDATRKVLRQVLNEDSYYVDET